MAQKTAKPDLEVVEGFTHNGVAYYCDEAECSKSYVYPNAARKHKEMHTPQTGLPEPEEKADEVEPVIEGFTYDGYTYHCLQCNRTYVKPGSAIKHKDGHAPDMPVDVTTGGALLRQVASDLRAGKFDLNVLIERLDLAGTIVDMLLVEIKKANIRELQQKANAWDLVVEILAKDPGMVKVIASAGK